MLAVVRTMSSFRVLRGVRAAAHSIVVGEHVVDGSEEAEAEARAAAERERAAEAATERERLRTEAERAGHAEGRARAEQETQAQLERLTSLLDGAIGEYTDAVRASQDDLVELALAIGAKLARTSLQVDPAGLQRLVEAALEHVGQTARVIVRVHPDDHAWLAAHEQDLRARLKSGAELDVQADPGLEPRTGCVIQTVSGKIDPRFETQLEEISAELLGHAAHADDD